MQASESSCVRQSSARLDVVHFALWVKFGLTLGVLTVIAGSYRFAPMRWVP